jgi:DNA polymerase III delta prime subunit
MKVNTLWVEKHRPTTLETYIGNETLVSYIKDCLAKDDVPHLLFYGSQGTGKTTLAKIIANHPDFDSLIINASNERGIDTIRDRITSFAQSSSFKKYKIIVLDEADYIMAAAQAVLRNTIETFSMKTRFIFTANYVERIIEPLRSRCQEFKIEPPTKGEVAKHVAQNILTPENIEFDIKDVAEIINKFFPDIRKIIGVCQQSVKDGALVLDDSVLGANVDDLVNGITESLKKPSKTTFNDIRQRVADSEVLDYAPLYSGLWDKINVYAKDHDGEIAIHLAQYLWSHNTVVDKELNFMACIAQVLNVLK